MVSVVLGGAGFLGSHLVESLVALGREVFVVDDFSSGHASNLESVISSGRVNLVEADICLPIDLGVLRVDEVFNLASPASPPQYMSRRLHTLRTGSLGLENAVLLALKHEARLVQASTSEVYGDPQVHPQPESYWGYVNPVGDRSCYDEAKRFGEAYCVAASVERDLNVGIVRIFNTYGPRLSPLDGRVVSNFVSQALSGRPISIYGDGSQTRSFCFVSDLVDGLVRMAESRVLGPINLGNPEELSISQVAEKIIDMTHSPSVVSYFPLPSDDPVRRKPDIARAKIELGWAPSVAFDEGLSRTIAWFKGEKTR